MRLATLRRPKKQTGLPGVLVTARVGRATRDLARRLGPGDVAIIDHLDLDQRTAQVLVASGVTAIVNAAPSTSGRFPNLGPRVVVAAGVPLVDQAGPELLRAVEDGETLRLDGDTLYRGEQVVAHGDLLTPADVDVAMEHARRGLATQLEAFAANAAEHLRRERDLVLDGAGVPELRTPVKGRPVLVVAARHGAAPELRALRHWIRENEPVLLGVDDGADALLEAGHAPHVVVGDLDTVSDAALTSGAEVVLHIARDGRAAAVDRLADLGVDYTTFVASAAPEELALLLVDVHEASLVALAGSPSTLAEMIDEGRGDLPGTFLARLRLGPRLVDARALATLYHRRPAVWPLVAILLLAVAGLVAAVALTGTHTLDATVLGEWWDDLTSFVTGLG